MKSILTVLLLFLAAGAAQAQSAEDLLQQALRLERTDGDYPGAIALYERVASDEGVDRRISGRALIQLARAYENLGRSEAARTYRRVLADYADMPDLTAEARQGVERTREAVTDTPSEPEPMSRTTVDLPMNAEYMEEWGASLSPSGRYMVAARYEPPGVGLLEIGTGDIQVFPINPGEKGYGEFPRMSPDERTIAVSWEPEKSTASDVILVDVSTSQHRVLLHTEAYLTSLFGWTIKSAAVQVHDWTQDGATLLVSIHGSVEGHDPGSDVFEGFLLVPVDGSEPSVVGGPQSLSVGPRNTVRIAWEYTCLSKDGRFALADFRVDGPGPPRRIIRRLDTTTGEFFDWRTSASVDFGLWGCTWTTGDIIYAQMAAGTQTILAALPTDTSPFDDRRITQLPESDWTFLGSKRGDIAVLQRRHNDLYVVDLDPVSGEALTRPKRIGEDVKSSSLTAWSPNGRRIAWWGEGTGPLMIWDTETDQRTQLDHGPPFMKSGTSWITDSVISLAKLLRDRPMDAKTVWDDVHIDLETGVRVDSISGETFSRHNLRARYSIPDGPYRIGWSAESGCLVRLNLETDGTTPFLCVPELGAHSNVVLIPSPDRSRYLIWGQPTPDTLSIGIVDRDGSGYRELVKESLGDVQVGEAKVDRRCRASWGRPNEVIVGCGPVRISTLKRIDVDSGEITEPYGALLAQFDLWQFRLSPDGTRAAIHGSGKGAVERLGTMTVIHNVLGSQ